MQRLQQELVVAEVVLKLDLLVQPVEQAAVELVDVELMEQQEE
jgi:hypothetical protein